MKDQTDKKGMKLELFKEVCKEREERDTQTRRIFSFLANKRKDDRRGNQIQLALKKQVLEQYRCNNFCWVTVNEYFPKLSIPTLKGILSELMVVFLSKLNKEWRKVCPVSEIQQLPNLFLELTYQELVKKKIQKTEEGDIDLVQVLSDYMFLSKSDCDQKYSDDVKSILHVLLKKIMEESRKRGLQDDGELRNESFLPEYIYNRKRLSNEITKELKAVNKLKRDFVQKCKEEELREEDYKEIGRRIDEFAQSYNNHASSLQVEKSFKDFEDPMQQRRVYIFFCYKLLNLPTARNRRQTVEKIYGRNAINH